MPLRVRRPCASALAPGERSTWSGPESAQLPRARDIQNSGDSHRSLSDMRARQVAERSEETLGASRMRSIWQGLFSMLGGPQRAVSSSRVQTRRVQISWSLESVCAANEIKEMCLQRSKHLYSMTMGSCGPSWRRDGHSMVSEADEVVNMMFVATVRVPY